MDFLPSAHQLSPENFSLWAYANVGASSCSGYLGGSYIPLVILCCLEQGSPIPWPWTSTGLQPVRNQAAQQEVSSGWASKPSSAAPHFSPSITLPPWTIPPHCSYYCLNHPSPCPPSAEKLSSTKSVPGAKKVGDRLPTALCPALNRH